jgi:hypothetical protein
VHDVYLLVMTIAVVTLVLALLFPPATPEALASPAPSRRR